MINCRLSMLLAERKMKVSELSRETGLNKNTLHRLYNETATRIDLDTIEILCRFFEIDACQLFVLTDNKNN